MYRRVLALASGLQRHGVGKGDAFSVIGGNTPDVYAAAAAGIVVGASFVALNPDDEPAANADRIRRAGVSALLFEPGEFDDLIYQFATDAGVKDVFAVGRSSVADDILDLGSPTEHRFVPPVLDEADPAAVLYTGGTTGRAKGVRLSHRALSYQALHMAAQWQWPSEIRLVAMPQHAIHFLVPGMLRGGSVVLVPGGGADDVLRAVVDNQATMAWFPGALFYGLLEAADGRRPPGTESLETILYGLTPIPAARIQEAVRIYGNVFIQFYALAEAVAVAVLRKEEHDVDRLDRLASCGRPLAGIDLAIQDEAGQQVEVGEIGEVCVRGGVVMDGYLDDEARTEHAFRGGWLHTGDLGRYDAEGFVRLLGRRADVIDTATETLLMLDIENVLASHPAVMTAAAVPLPAEPDGAQVIAAAVVSRSPSGVDANELIEFAAARMTRGHVPARIQVMERLPLQPNGKPDKKALKQLFTAGV
jgi:fatty-acyl-CoA synthase